MIRAAIKFVVIWLAAASATAGTALGQPIEERYASFVVDLETDRVLHARNADELRYPASLTKMMTLYLLFDALEAGEIGLNDQMMVSQRAAAQEPSKIYVKAGGTLRVEDAILALTTKSANDAAVVIGERLGGSVENFARMMTEKSRELGMTRTRWRNPNGLPDEAQVTTARDLAKLGEALFRDHPTYYAYFKATEFRYGNVTYRNHNRLLANMDGVEGVDGIKTGYIRAAGYNLVTSAERDGRRIVAVVLGGSTSRVRDAHMADLVQQAFVALEADEPEPILVATLSPTGEPLSHLKGAPLSDPETERANALEQEQTIALASLELSRPAEQGDASADRGVRIVFADTAGAPAPEEKAKEVPATVQPVVLRMPAEPDPKEPEREPALRTALRAESDEEFGPGWQIMENHGEFAGWQIQVGAYRDQDKAQDRLSQLEAMALTVLAGAASHIENATVNDASWYRARFAGLSEKAAREACATLTASGDGCFTVRPNT